MNTTQDNLLVGGLVTSPAWAPWLSTFNEILTTVTLILGLIIGVLKLLSVISKMKRQKL